MVHGGCWHNLRRYNGIREHLTVYWKRNRKQKVPTEDTGVADRRTCVLKRTWPLTTIDKLVLSQEDQPQTHRSTFRYPETDLTQSSWIICCELGLNFLKCPRSRCAHELTAAIVSFTCINVSQGSVVTQFRWGEIINKHVTANFPQSVPLQEFLKSVNIWRRYGQKYGSMFFLTHSVVESNTLNFRPDF